ncbi:hypothetical protein PTKIN_Ptkin17bG0139500 [Pterospermum kingtungense]
MVNPQSHVGSQVTPACSPSTAKSGRYSLLCRNQPHAVPSTLGTTRPRAFAQIPWLNSLLGTGRPEAGHYGSDSVGQANVPPPQRPHLGHKLTLPSSTGERTRCG